MSTIKITALDSLFFRDPRPFTIGEDNIAANLFPQIPGSALLGAIKTAYASEKNFPVSEIKKRTSDIQINYMGLLLDDEPVFPIPADCICNKDEIVLLKLTSNKNSSIQFPKLLSADKKEKSEDISGYRIKFRLFNKYWNAPNLIKLASLSLLQDYYVFEPKIGIAREKGTRKTRDGALYSVNMVKTEGKQDKYTHIFAGIDGVELANSGFIRLGGEGKVAYYERIELSQPNTPEWQEHNIGFKFYLATPSVFKHGYLPEWLDPESLEGEIAGFKIKLETAAFGRFIPYGGFDLELNKPKSVYKAIPAGAVYYFTCMDTTQNEQAYNAIKNYFQHHRFTDMNANEGLGWVFVGPY